MATTNSSPIGFSYAQAARGHAAAAPSSKTPPVAATPAADTFSELEPNSTWADDVEATVRDKNAEAKNATPEQKGPTPVNDSVVKRAKSETRGQMDLSGVSSPDLAATGSTTTNTDESSSAVNGTSSETTWETKSQNSEPAWIAERKERQSSGHNDEQLKSKRGKKESRDGQEPAIPETPAKPIVLQDAPPPAVNPWAKRLEDAKTKPVPFTAVPIPLKPATPLQNIPADNQGLRADFRRKANPIPNVARDIESRVGGDAKKSGSSHGTQGNNLHHSGLGSKQSTGSATLPNKPAQREHSSLSNLTGVPPSVKDEVSWPTPENAQEKERKDTPSEKEIKDVDESGDGETAGSNRTHQKTKWKPIAVTPTIVWETEEMNRPARSQGGERGGRGGNAARGRGGFRGAPAGSKAGDRIATKIGGSGSEGENNGYPTNQRGRSSTLNRGAIPSPPSLPKASRQASASNPLEDARNREFSSGERNSQAKRATGITATDENNNAVTVPTDTRQSIFPSRFGSVVSEDAKVTHSIARQNHLTVPEGNESVRAAPSAKRGSLESKKDSRSFDGFSGKEWNNTPRGGKRGGRGRGGSREYTNHQPNQILTNGHAEFTTPYGIPPSPSAYQSPRGQFGYAPQGRGGWPRGGPRSQSIPLDTAYGSRPFWPQQQQQHPPLQTYYPSMYDFNGVPMSALPYQPGMDQAYLMEMVSTQLEYYFSIDNLLKDMFLRKNMDSKGFVFLDVIANFNRIKQLTVDKDILRFVCLRSENIEIQIGEDGKERLRRSEGWERFLLPRDQREPSAQTDGPLELRRPEAPQLQAWMGSQPGFRSPLATGFPNSHRKSLEPGHALNGAVAQFSSFPSPVESPCGEPTNGDEVRGRATKSPMREASTSSALPDVKSFADHIDSVPDVFPNEHQNTLTVVVKMNPQRPPHYHVAARTFSNGSIDTRSIFGEMEKTNENHSQSNNSSGPAMNGDGAHTSITRHSSPGVGRSPEKNNSAPELMLLWVKDKEVPQESLPQDATLEPYISLRDKALGQRSEAATGTCPYDLDVLYQFWSHFLIRNFNRNMYGEFKCYAHDDAQNRHSSVGLQNLVQFYAKALASSIPIRESIVSDYVDLVKSEPTILQGLAFKQLRQAWRNGALNLKNRKKLADIVDEALKFSLES